jgi:RimJ/RimL family protein N-acetyltransferase
MSELYTGNQGIQVVTFGEEHVIDIFELIDSGRDHLIDEGISDKYPDLTSVFNSVAHPIKGRDRYVIVSDFDGVVGSINASVTKDPSDLIIGYWIGKSKIGKGYASLAVDALATGLLDRWVDITTLSAHVLPENVASQKTLTRAGFTLSGVVDTDKGPEQLYERHR